MSKAENEIGEFEKRIKRRFTNIFTSTDILKILSEAKQELEKDSYIRNREYGDDICIPHYIWKKWFK